MSKKERRRENVTLSEISKPPTQEERGGTKKFNEAETIKRLRSYRAPDDIVASIFCFLDENKSPSDRKLIHESMKHIKDDFPEMMSDFIFTTGDVFSYSPLLERILGRLQISSTIEMINPSGAYYLINPSVKEDLRKYTSILFTEEEQGKLKKMASMYQELAMPRDR